MVDHHGRNLVQDIFPTGNEFFLSDLTVTDTHKLGRRALILSAGMPRSASTWLYNAARLVLSANAQIEPELAAGWIGDWNALPKTRYRLVKVHDAAPELLSNARFCLYSYRDIRDSVASLKRKFARAPSLQQADVLVEQYRSWIGRADLVMRYEDMIEDKLPLIRGLASLFGVQDVDPIRVIEQLDGLRYDSDGSGGSLYHKENLYHDGHVTDGRHGSWSGDLEPALVREIEHKHERWFLDNGYSVGS